MFYDDKDTKFLYFCDMKKSILPLLGLAMALGACTHETDSLVGTWTVDKVKVQFDEHRSTPELVKQVGEMEKQNVISISKDSILTFKGLEESWQDRICLKNDTLLHEGTALGIWKDGSIVTRTNSPLGDVVVTYRKK